MNNNIAYNITDVDKILLDKMNFNVINLKPKYSHDNTETTKSEIETKLFDIFNKYASGHWKQWFSVLSYERGRFIS